MSTRVDAARACVLVRHFQNQFFQREYYDEFSTAYDKKQEALEKRRQTLAWKKLPYAERYL